jgi:hypothetical protein
MPGCVGVGTGAAKGANEATLKNYTDRGNWKLTGGPQGDDMAKGVGRWEKRIGVASGDWVSEGRVNFLANN